MREWCGCGAGISGKPKQVAKWRKNHRHPVEHQDTHSDTERSEQDDDGSVRIGFQMNERQGNDA
ncbi:hypothetical protein GCM10027056_22300 [Glaciibacter psychrotolerans]